jgi:hypothetical protein
LTLVGDLAVNGGDITTTATTFNFVNANATTVSMAGAATTLNIGNATAGQTISIGSASTGTSTYNFATGGTASGQTKTVSIGTGSAAASTTNINIGTGSGTSTVTLGTTVGGTVTANNVIRSGLAATATALDLAVTDGYASLRVIRNSNSSGSYTDGMYIGYQNGNSGSTKLFGGGSTTVSATINAQAVASTSNSTGTVVVNGGISANARSCFPNILINRENNATHGISWYSSGYTAWSEYMAQAGTASTGPSGTVTAPSGTLVTSWAQRSFIENSAGYGWTFEGGTSTGTTPSVVAEIRASDGAARFGAVTNAGFLGSGSANARNHFTQYNSGAATAATGWIAAAFGDTNASRTVIGQASGYATLGAHNANLTDWAPLFIQNDSSSATVMIGFPWNTAPDSSFRLKVNGAFAATTKSFLIDHPTKPGMQLRYGSLEGPENGVYVRGRLTDNNVIELPDYWTGLVDENSITVNLTAIGKAQDLYVEDIKDNKVYVGGSSINCFYTVFAERKDVDKLVVEFE